jgi:hypothetical protein
VTAKYDPIDYTDLRKAVLDTSNPEKLFSTVQEMKQLTASLPAMFKKASDDPSAGIHSNPAARGPKAVFYDPLSLQYALGYKDRRFSLTYDTLRRIAHQVSVIASIINTRIAQVSAFSDPYRQTKSLGFQIKHKSPDHMTTDSEREFIERLEMFVATCGEPGKTNPYSRMKRPKFESFIKMIVRDTLVYDQLGFEIIPRRNGIPFEFWPLDAATLRLASPDRDVGMQFSYHHRNPIAATFQPHRFANLYEGQSYGDWTASGRPVRYVQIVNGQIENVFTDAEVAFGIRNPRTDIYIQGYGYGELEQLITIVTGILYAEEYNRRFFTQGAHPKGLLNFKGDNWTPDQLEAFKRQWVSQIAGTENAWKTPITQSEGIEWVDLQRSNQEMGFQGWLEYLLKITCGVFLIDPAEINFDLHGGVQQTPLFESSQEWKLKASRDRGLKPLLKFIAGMINEHVIDRIDDHFAFEFAGLDELTEQEKHELLKDQLGSYLTLNEVRRQLDLQEIPGGIGEVPLNPTLVQLLQMQQQREDQKQQMEQQQQQQSQDQQTQEQQAQQAQMQDPEKEQKVRHAEDKHPLDMQILQQKIQQGSAQMGMQGAPQDMGGVPPEMGGSAEPGMEAAGGAEGSPEMAGGEPGGGEVAPEEQALPPAARPQGDAKKQYSALFGKSITFDDFVEFMRSR